MDQVLKENVITITKRKGTLVKREKITELDSKIIKCWITKLKKKQWQNKASGVNSNQHGKLTTRVVRLGQPYRKQIKKK